MNRELAWEIVGCLRVAGTSEIDKTRWMAFSLRQWQIVLDWLDASGLALLFWKRLQELGSEAVAPLEVRKRLARNLADHRVRIDSMAEEFDGINRCLEQAAGRYAVLKGFALIPDYCPDASLRTAYDYDYLLPAESMVSVQRTLEANGYVRKPDREEHPIVYFQASRPLWLPSRQEDLYAAGLPRTIELHYRFWDNASVGIPLGLPEDALTRIRLRDWRGLRFYSLGEEDELIFHVLHAFRHILNNWCRLCSFLEIAYFLERRSADATFWERFTERIRCAPALSEIVGVVFLLATRLFGARMSPTVARLTTQNLPRSLALWVEHYGIASALENFSENKFSLFLHREFIPDDALWREMRRIRLFPLQRPNLAAQASRPGLLTHLAATWRQGVYVSGRLAHHLMTAAQYGWESSRWRRLRAGGR